LRDTPPEGITFKTPHPSQEARMTVTVGQDSTKTRTTLSAGGQTVSYYSIPAAEAAGLGSFARLPAALKVVLENMLRFEDGRTVTVDDIRAFSEWGAQGGRNPREIAYRPARVLMQDFTGVPAVVDLAAMRDGIIGLGGDPQNRRVRHAPRAPAQRRPRV
jgi:aconitate hydratase